VQVDSGAVLAAEAFAHLTVERDAEVGANDHVLTLLRVLRLRRDREQRPLILLGSDADRLAR
jgi:hypothetical protein